MKKIFLQLLPMVASFMKFKPDATEPLNFSDEDKKKLDEHAKQEGFAEAFMKHFNEEHLQANDEAMKAFGAFMESLNVDAANSESDEEGDEASSEIPKTDAKTTASALQALVKKAEGLVKTNAQLAADNEKLKTLPEEDKPEAVIQFDPNNSKAVKHSATHLFASGQSYDSLDRPWNKNVANAQKQGVVPKGATVWNKVNIDKLNDDLGAYARRNSNEIFDLLKDGYDIPEHWEVITNIQDEHVFTGVTTGQITQAFKKGWLPKNKQRFVPVINKIFDKQIDITWEASELKSIEKSWLNMFFNEGSTPYKDSFALYLIKKLMKKARKEDKISIFTGVYSDPEKQPEVAGDFLNSMSGFLKIVDNNRGVTYQPHYLPTLTKSNAYDVINSWCEGLPLDIKNTPLKLGSGTEVFKWYMEGYKLKNGLYQDYEKLPGHVEDMPNITFTKHAQLEGSGFIYLAPEDLIGLMVDKPGEEELLTLEKHKRAIDGFADWKLGVWIKAFGANVDPNAAITYEDQVFFSNNQPILTETYVPVVANDATPSVAEHHALKIGGNNTAATDVTNFDDVADGQYIYLIGDASANLSKIKNNANIVLADGSDFTLAKGDKLTLVKSNGKLLEYSRTVAAEVSLETKVSLADGATTADATNGTWFVTQANAGATVITNITNAVIDEVYTIEGGSATNSTTIASGGNFLLSAGFTATVGAILKVKYNGSKFVEVSRS